MEKIRKIKGQMKIMSNFLSIRYKQIETIVSSDAKKIRLSYKQGLCKTIFKWFLFDVSTESHIVQPTMLLLIVKKASYQDTG